jgi:hypothetical protein
MLTYITSWIYWIRGIKEQDHLQTKEEINQNLELMTKRKTLLEKKIEEQKIKALDHKKNKKTNEAIVCMKRIKLFQQEIDRLDAKFQSLESVSQNIEEAIINKEYIDSMKKGSKTVENIYGNKTVEQIHNEIEDITEVMQDAIEKSNIISQNIITNDLDDGELLKELEELGELDNENIEVHEKKTFVKEKIVQEEKEDEILLKEFEEKIINEIENSNLVLELN